MAGEDEAGVGGKAAMTVLKADPHVQKVSVTIKHSTDTTSTSVEKSGQVKFSDGNGNLVPPESTDKILDALSKVSRDGIANVCRSDADAKYVKITYDDGLENGPIQGRVGLSCSNFRSDSRTK